MITAGLTPSYGRNLRQLPNSQNVSTIIRYIQVMRTEINFSDHYRKDVIDLLTRFCNFTHHKTFKDISREDVIEFLDLYRKPESVDPLHRWIGTYNQYRMHLFRFFKWLYSPEVEYKKRPSPPLRKHSTFET